MMFLLCLSALMQFSGQLASHASATPSGLELPDQETRPRKEMLLLRSAERVGVAFRRRPAGRPWAMVGSAARAPGRQLFQTRLPRGGANLDPDPRLTLPPPAAERSA